VTPSHVTDAGSSGRLVLALDNALSMFDESVKQAIYFHLKQKGVSVEASNADQLEIEHGLRDLMSSGADIILVSMRKEMDKIINLQ
jgi:hypothetical protein